MYVNKWWWWCYPMMKLFLVNHEFSANNNNNKNYSYIQKFDCTCVDATTTKHHQQYCRTTIKKREKTNIEISNKDIVKFVFFWSRKARQKNSFMICRNEYGFTWMIQKELGDIEQKFFFFRLKQEKKSSTCIVGDWFVSIQLEIHIKR